MGAKNTNILEVKIEIHILKLMEVKMVLWALYIIMDYQCLVTSYFYINFKYIIV